MVKQCHKILFYMLLVCLIPVNFSYGNENETIIIGFFKLEPHIYPEKGEKVKGAAVEYWERYLAPEMKVVAEWKGPVSYKRLLKELKDGRVHAGVILGKNSDREAFLFYPKDPFYSARPALVVRNDFPLREVRGVEDVTAIKTGYVQGGYLSPFMRDPRIKFDNVSSPNWAETNFRKLLKKRFDAIYFPELSTARYYKNTDYNGFRGGPRKPPKEADISRLCSQLS